MATGEILKDSINRANPNTLADELRSLKFGDVLAALPVSLRKASGAASDSVAAAAFATVGQQSFARAALIASAHARAGAGTPGALSPVAYPPAAPNDIAIAPNGDVVTLAADAWTDLDVTYLVEKGDVVQVDIPVVPATGVGTVPANLLARGLVLLIDATATAGTVTGAKEIVAPGGPPAAGEANLTAAKGSVGFAVADAVTSATVTLLVASAVDVSAALAAPSIFE